MRFVLFTATIALAVVAGCDRPRTGARTAAGTIVDSILPVAEEIRRFESGLAGSRPIALESGLSSRDALVREYALALERKDTTRLRDLAVSASEFIALYYPNSRFTEPPYRQSPAILWFLMQQSSEKGISTALAQFGGRPAGFRGVECPNSVIERGPIRLWEGCVVRWSGEGKPDPAGLFGTIIETGNRFKFLSYANDL